MNTHLDPAWAWAPYEPSAERPWNLRTAAHLYRRAGLGATHGDLVAANARSPGEVVDALLDTEEPAFFADEIAVLEQAAVASGKCENLSAAWTYRLLHTPAPLRERMTLFWHGHFATSAAKVEDPRLMLAQNRLLREHALGEFGALAQAISKDPAMLVFLDSATNRKAHPNENFARELMELFCLGEGAYTETDIRQLARCFTGWEIRRDKFRFNRYQHDDGEKSLLGQSGAFSGEAGVDLVLAQSAAPRFLVGKLARLFLADEPPLPDEVLEPLAVELRQGGMQIQPIVRRILASNLFFSPHAVGRKIRSPVDLLIGFLRAFEGSTDCYQLAAGLRGLGQGLFYPPSVKGWDGGRTWINSSTLLGRSNLFGSLLANDKTRFGRQPLADYLRSQGLSSAERLIERFETSLLAMPLSDVAKQQISELYDNAGPDFAERARQAVLALCTLPAFQLG